MLLSTRAPSTIVTVNLTGQTDYTIPFEYLTRRFVQLTLQGSVERKVLQLGIDYRFVSKTTIALSNPYTVGYTKLEIRRITSATERLVNYHDGSILRAYDLNLSQIQTLHVAEEARDLLALSLGLNGEGHLDARGRRIVNVADGVLPNDAVNVGQIEDIVSSGGTSALREALAAADGSKLVGYKGRTVYERLGDVVHLKDFGAVCDGVTDDSVAFEAFVRHLATNGGHGILPAGRIGLTSRTYNAAALGNKPFSIKGAGKRATVLYNVSKTNHGHLIAWSGFEQGTMLSDFSVDAGRDRMTTPPVDGNGAMVAINCQYMLVEDVLWDNFTAVGFMSYNDHPTNPTKTYHHLHVHRCEADGKTYWRPGQGSGPNATFGSGILIADMNDSTIINCHTRWTSQYSIEYKNSCSRTIIAHCSITDAYNGLYYGGNSALKDERYVKDSIITNCIMTRVKNPLWLGTADRNVVTDIVINNRGIESTMCVVIRDGHHNVVRGVKVYGRTTYLIDIRTKSTFNTIEFDYIEDDDSMTVHGGYINPDSPNNTVIYPETYKSNAEFIHFSARKSVDAIFIDKRKGTVVNTTKDGRRSFKQYGAITVDALPLPSTWYGDAYLQGGGKDYSRHSIADGNYYYDRYYKMGQNGYAPAFVRATLTTSPDYRIYLQTDSQSSSQTNFTFAPNRFFCAADGVASCGASTARWSVVFAVQGTINTSDAREKTAPMPIDDRVLDAWGDVQLIAFKWLEAIRLKGEDMARIHHGVMAQQVRDTFEAHGLDGTDYGLLCYDEWEDIYDWDDEKKTFALVTPAGSRWGIRPDQCLFVEAAYARRRFERLEARVAKLEGL
ncbi:tail fiber protein [Aeromonas phage JELG-KS1]|uniref:Probable tail spike protein n=1 Tax=Aeromonas phage JELG-KS1 TaxID=2951233 RepID=A0A9E7NLQ8_9CAUD|nr:tail fiber protein [Aeromonas phage JELG-KS1]